MRSWDAREVLVVDDDGALCGLLRDTDVIVIAIASGRSPSELTAAECCDVDVPRVEADQFIVEAIEVMRFHQVRRLPVVEGSQLLGTVWLNDLEQAAAHLSAADPRPRPRALPRPLPRPQPRPADRALRPLRPGWAVTGPARRPLPRGAARRSIGARRGESD
jgi:CBS-domain-containing membrane protein